MNSDEKARVVQECTDLIMSLNHCSDTHEYEESVKHFSSDAVFVAAAGNFVGHEQILKMYKARSPTVVSRHMVTNVRVDIKDDNNAEAISYFLTFIVDPKKPDAELPLSIEPFSMGEWYDSFVRTSNGWKLSRHDVKRIFFKDAKKA